MGLFSRKECVLCGGKAGLLTRYSLSGGEFICGDCRNRMSSNVDSIGSLTLEGVKVQIRLKEENNARYRSEFVTSRRIDVDSSHPIMAVDDTHGWFALLTDKDPDIFSFDQITSCNVDLKTSALSEEERKNDSGLMYILSFLQSDDFCSRYPKMPRCPMGCKVTGMRFEISFGPNPFNAKKVSLDMLPSWTLNKTEIEKAYMCANDLCQCISEYKSGSRVQAKVQAQAAPTAADATDQIKKLKELLDMGALTQEEFDAKKRSLLAL